jgi:hypothetical protein
MSAMRSPSMRRHKEWIGQQKHLIGEVHVRGPLENYHRPALGFEHAEMILYVVYKAL